MNYTQCSIKHVFRQHTHGFAPSLFWIRVLLLSILFYNAFFSTNLTMIPMKLSVQRIALLWWLTPYYGYLSIVMKKNRQPNSKKQYFIWFGQSINGIWLQKIINICSQSILIWTNNRIIQEDDVWFDKICSLFHYHLKSDRKWLVARVNNFSRVIRVYSPYKCFNDVTSSSE